MKKTLHQIQVGDLILDMRYGNFKLYLIQRIDDRYKFCDIIIVYPKIGFIHTLDIEYVFNQPIYKKELTLFRA